MYSWHTGIRVMKELLKGEVFLRHPNSIMVTDQQTNHLLIGRGNFYPTVPCEAFADIITPWAAFLSTLKVVE